MSSQPAETGQAHAAGFSHTVRALSRGLSRLIDRYQPSETTVLLVTALLVGSLTGLLAVGLIELIHLAQTFFYHGVAGAWPGWGRAWVIVLPVLGGLIAGPILLRIIPEARGSGIPNVMEALILQNGRIRARVAPLKLLLTAITLGSGGSAGREGPVVHIGAAVGSTLANLLRLSANRTRNLVACGAAAGIAASFNAPIAGVAFAIEELGGELGVSMLGNVVLAAVAASIVSRSLLPDAESFILPVYQLGHPALMLFYAVLGVVTGLWGVAYIKVFYGISDFFDNLQRLPAWVKPAVGGLLVGLISFIYPLLLTAGGVDATLARAGTPVADFIPHIAGAGFDVIEMALRTPLPWLLLLALLALKLVATSITLGSGAAGGMFAPALFMGAMLGGLFGQAGEWLFPQAGIQPGAFALAGMAGVLTGAVRAPLTSILIVFEMTNDYAFVLPLMATTIVSALVGQALHHDSMYTLWLVRRGIHLRHGRDVDVLDAVLVREVMTSTPLTVPVDMSLPDFQRQLAHTHAHGAAVIGAAGELAGVATITDLEKLPHASPHLCVRDIMTRTLLTAYADESIGAALQRMSARDIGRMPVVDRGDPTRLVGLIRRSDIIRAYQHGLLRRDDMQDRANQLRISRRAGGTEFVELHVQAGSSAAGQRVAALQLPPECLLTTRRHGNHLHLLHGQDVLEVGDIVLALCEPRHVNELEALFAQPVAAI